MIVQEENALIAEVLNDEDRGKEHPEDQGDHRTNRYHHQYQHELCHNFPVGADQLQQVERSRQPGVVNVVLQFNRQRGGGVRDLLPDGKKFPCD